MHTNAEGKGLPERVVSMDQLRGYAIFGMFLVNASFVFFEPIASTLHLPAARRFLDACLFQLQHHEVVFTYADTIAPLFVFVVGMGMRISWLRRVDRAGRGPTRKSLVKRYALLVLIAFALYAGWLWDALMDIGLAGLLAVPLIDKSPRVRIAAAFGYVALYQMIFSFTSYGAWVVHGAFSLDEPGYVPLLVRLLPLDEQLFGTSLNGGPLGPLSWSMMLLFGTVASDMLRGMRDRTFIACSLGWGAGLCALAFALHVAWPGVKEAWPFSARYMTAPFPLWATGLCFLQMLGFYLFCDKLRLTIPTFTSVGMNPLVIYIAQSLLLDVIEDFAPPRLSVYAGVGGFLVFWSVFAAAAHYMRRRAIFIKI